MDKAFIKEIEALVNAKFEEADWEDCFLVEVRLNKGNKLEVFMDADSGVTFEKCRRLSRYLESAIDEAGWLGEKYGLDVSSPGVDRPLTLPRQYRKNIGRKLEVKTEDGQTRTGLLVDLAEAHIVLEEKVRETGKKKKVPVQSEIPFASIIKAVVKISFK